MSEQEAGDVHIEGNPDGPAVLAGDGDAALLAAVKAAQAPFREAAGKAEADADEATATALEAGEGDEGKDGDKSGDKPGPAKAKPEAGEGEEAKPPESNAQKIQRVLAERKERNQARQMKQEADRRVAEMQARAEAAEKQAQQTQARMQHLELLRAGKDPIKNARELGLDPQKLIEAASLENSPEGQLRNYVEELRAWTAEQVASANARVQKAEEKIAFYESQGKQTANAKIESDYLAKAAEYPALHALYGDEPQEILRRGYDLVEQVRAATGGKRTCTDEEILSYLNEQAEGKLAKVRGEASAPSGTVSQGTKAKGPRTLSARGPSERRASPKPLDEMTEAEQEAYLRQVSREARKAAS